MLRSLIRIVLVVTGAALVAVGLIVGYNNWHLESLARVSSQQSEEIHAKSVAGRNERQALEVALRAADKIADPLKRCLEFPDVPPLQWDTRFVDDFCRLSTLQIVSIEEIERKLAAGDATGVDATFDGYAAQDASDPTRRGILFRSFETLFESNNPATGEIVERWVKAAPNSANALAARGIFRKRSASEARGSAYANETPQANFDAMHRLMALAKADLEAALKINPRFVIPATYLITVTSRMGNKKEVEALGRKAVELGPHEYRVYTFWANEASPLWGGSSGELDEVMKAAKAQVNETPLMALVQARGRYYQLRVAHGQLSKADYLDILAIAPDSLALKEIGTLPLAPDDVAMVTQLVRFEPTVENYMSAAFALAYGQQIDWANDYTARAVELGSPTTTNLVSYARALAAVKKHEAAETAYLKILAANARSADAMSALAGLYETNLGRHDDAVAMAQRYIDAYPDSHDGWLVMADTMKKSDTTKYCEAKAKAYPDMPKKHWDYDGQCGTKR